MVLFFGTTLGLLSRIGGWSEMAAMFECDNLPDGNQSYFQSARIGWINYGSCLILMASDSGLYMSVLPLFRFGHPPLLIPWDRIKIDSPSTGVLSRSASVSVDAGRPIIITLPARFLPHPEASQDGG